MNSSKETTIEYWVYGLDTKAPKSKQNGYDDAIVAPISQRNLGSLMCGHYADKIRVHSTDTGDDWLMDPKDVQWLRIEVCHVAAIIDLNSLDSRFRHLARETAELFRQLHIRRQFRRILRTHGRHDAQRHRQKL